MHRPRPAASPAASPAACLLALGGALCVALLVACSDETAAPQEPPCERCLDAGADALPPPALDAAPEPPDADPDAAPDPDAELTADATPDPPPPVPYDGPTCLPAATPLDLLVVIDDSGSMCEEQSALADALVGMHRDLQRRGIDYHLAVVTTDMDPGNPHRAAFGPPPAPPAAVPTCVGPSGEPFVPDTDHCAALALEPVLDPAALDPDTLDEHLRCMAQLGTDGDGFEKGLAAIVESLDCAGPNADLLGACCADPSACDRPFLRPGAALGVVILSDEDDCTDAAALIDPAPAVGCDAAAPGEPCQMPRRDNNTCAWYADRLVPTAELAATLHALRPAALTAAAVVGPPHPLVDGHPVRFVPGEIPDDCLVGDERVIDAVCCPDGACPGDVTPICLGHQGGALAAPRYHAFIDDLIGAGACAGDACASICALGADPIGAALSVATAPCE